MTVQDIVYVDDRDSYARTLGRQKGLKGRIHYVDSREVGANSLPAAASANLWLFDFFYDEDDADEQASPEPVFGERSGMTVLKSWEAYCREARPVSLLLSGHLSSALGTAIIPARRHVLAIEHGVDWIAPKASDTIETAREIAALADACKSARSTIASRPCDDEIEGLARELMKLPEDRGWANAALVQFSHTPAPRWTRRVPLPSGADGDANLATARNVLVWMLHRVLPYAGLLISDVQAAARLGVTVTAFRTLAEAKPSTPFGRELGKARYKGVLAEFAGRRWWRAGIDLLVWQTSRSERGLRAEIARYVPGDDAFLPFTSPVVVSDDDLVETQTIADSSTCIRVVDRYAPPDALAIWLERDDVVGSRELRAWVAFEDRDKLRGVDAS